MNWKKFTLTLLCVLSLLSLAAQERGAIAPATNMGTAPEADTAYVFRFTAGRDMFYVPYSGNDKELARLQACVEQYKKDILSGNTPLYVDGYCNSAATERENLAIAKTRSNRVKSELIVRSGLTEACFITRNHSGGGDYVTVRLVVPVTDNKAEPDTVAIERERVEQAKLEAERLAAEQRAEQERIAREQAEKERLAREQAEREAARKAETERPAAGEAARAERTKQADRNPVAGWYAGIQGGVPFGVSALSSFGADKTRAGWSAGIYGGYRFNPVLSLELQATWGQTNLSARDCCPGYWLGSDGNLYEGAVAGMTGWGWHDLKSRVRMQRYGVQLNVNLLGFFAATKHSRWTLELAPHLYAVGTEAEFRTLAGNAQAMKGATRWHLGAGGNLQAGYALTEHLRLGIYTGLTYLTGQPLDGTPGHLHKANCIWESGLRIGWSFGNTNKRKEGNK